MLTAALLIVVHLHHIDPREILLHLFSIFDTLAVNHVVDMLDFIWTHIRQILLWCWADAQNRLVNG